MQFFFSVLFWFLFFIYLFFLVVIQLSETTLEVKYPNSHVDHTCIFLVWSPKIHLWHSSYTQDECFQLIALRLLQLKRAIWDKIINRRRRCGFMEGVYVLLFHTSEAKRTARDCGNEVKYNCDTVWNTHISDYQMGWLIEIKPRSQMEAVNILLLSYNPHLSCCIFSIKKWKNLIYHY